MSQQINLFDPALLRKRDWLSLANVVGGAVLLAALVFGAGLLARSELAPFKAQARDNATQLEALRAQVVALGRQTMAQAPDAQVQQELASLRQSVALRGEVVAALRQRLAANALPWSETLRALARQTRPGVWLTGLRLDAETDGIEIRGRTLDPALLPDYLQRLNREAAFRGRAFAALQLTAGTAAASAGKSAESAAAFHDFVLVPVGSPAATPGRTSP